jgi:pimeloyl-ACP methyl ester carboxylesterase
VLGWSQGGPIALAFAAGYPERVSHRVLYGTYARLTFADDYPIGRDPRSDGCPRRAAHDPNSRARPASARGCACEWTVQKVQSDRRQRTCTMARLVDA